MKDVTRQEVEAAAKESTLAAVRCSMKHHLYNTGVSSCCEAHVGPLRCALCTRFPMRPTCSMRYESEICPLKGDDIPNHSCCREYYEASDAHTDSDLKGCHTGFAKLYARLAKIEYDLMHPKDEKPDAREEEKKEYYPIATISPRVGPRLILNLPDEYLSNEYKGQVFSMGENGKMCTMYGKDLEFRYLYGDDEKKVFPIKE